MEFDMVGNETTGAGGFVCALRTVPVALEIAKDIERLSPQAWLLNLSNPAGIVTEALLKHSPVRTVGFCNIPINTQYTLSEILDVPPPMVRLDSFGLNHLSWVRGAYIEGQEMVQPLIVKVRTRHSTPRTPDATNQSTAAAPCHVCAPADVAPMLRTKIQLWSLDSDYAATEGRALRSARLSATLRGMSMPRFRERYGRWALVTGASSGIGEEFARALAARGMDLVILARRAELLDKIEREVHAAHGTSVRPIVMDLALDSAAAELAAAVADLEIGLLVNNAGTGWIGRFDLQRQEEHSRLVHLHCVLPVELTARLLQRRCSSLVPSLNPVGTRRNPRVRRHPGAPMIESPTP